MPGRTKHTSLKYTSLLIVYVGEFTLRISYRNGWGVPVALLWHGAFRSFDRRHEEGCLWPEVPTKYPKPVAKLWSKTLTFPLLHHPPPSSSSLPSFLLLAALLFIHWRSTQAVFFWFPSVLLFRLVSVRIFRVCSSFHVWRDAFFFMSLEAFIPLSGMGPWQEPLKPWWLLTTVILWSPLGLKWYSLWHPSSPRWLSSHSFALFLAAAFPVLFPGLCVYQREETGMHTWTFQCLSQGIRSCHHTARGQGTEGHGQNHWLISIVINNLCLI